MSEPSDRFEGRWMDKRQRGGSNTSQGINAKFLDCNFIRNPGFTFAQLLATIKQDVSSTLDDIGEE